MNRSPVRRAALLLLSVAALANLPAAAQGSSPPFDLSGAAVLAEGQSLFNRRCAGKCHGLDATAGEDAPSLRERSHLTPQIAWVMIAYGRPGTSMPAWKERLSEDELWRLVAYVVSLQKP